MCRQHQRLGQHVQLSEDLAAIGCAWWTAFCGFELLASHHTTSEAIENDRGVFLLFSPGLIHLRLSCQGVKINKTGLCETLQVPE
jgi:hypothetical protein